MKQVDEETCQVLVRLKVSDCCATMLMASFIKETQMTFAVTSPLNRRELLVMLELMSVVKAY